jgi:hypothetical protein
MQQMLSLEMFVEPSQQGSYLRLPFTMPAGVEALSLRYEYARHRDSELTFGSAVFTAREEINIIDLGLIAPDGSQAGASGSDKTEITLAATEATPGYRVGPLEPGQWHVLVGAYKVAPDGVTVRYQLTFSLKQRRLLKGDLHSHTLASDGVLTAAELAWRARRHGLDFLAITDHNQPVAASALPHVPGLTLIPGLEWTHFEGHANFLGCHQPYDEPFATNTAGETLARFTSARERGALISINHPFEEGCGFLLDMQAIPFDCLEVWNGPMRESNLKAIGLWHSWLAAGKKVPICGGSDYHRDTPFIFLGGPTTCVFADSASPADILDALRAGHAYITFAPNGPWLEFTASDAIMGDSLPWTADSQVELRAGGLLGGDVVRVVTAAASDVVVEAPADGQVRASVPVAAPGFARVEVLRAFIPGIPRLPALISNPIYFDRSG